MNKFKKLIKDYYLVIFIYVIAIISLLIPIPYYVDMPGGLIDISKRIEMEESYPVKGSLNLAYVKTVRANIAFGLFSFIMKDWDLIEKENIVSKNETIDDANYREQLFLEEANQTATILAYKKANEDIEIKNTRVYVTYIYDEADTTLKIKDQIIKIDDKTITNRDDISNYLETKKEDDLVSIEVINNNKKYIRKAYVKKISGNNMLGIYACQISDLELKNNIKFNFKNSEAGPSGGFMMTLAIYNYLIKDDITKGQIIAGTGMITETGSVLPIGGVPYKLMGAVKGRAKIFFVPEENYEEALKVKKEKGYTIEIVKVNTLDDAINYLKNTN